MPNKKTGHWLSLLKSFDLHFYPQIVNQPFGRSFKYLMLVCFIISLLLSTQYLISFNGFVGQAKSWVSGHINEIWPQGLNEVKVESGQVSSDTPQPFTHKWGEFALVLDTTGKINSLNEYKSGLLVTKNKVIIKQKKTEVESDIKEYELSKVRSFFIRKGDAGKGVISEVTVGGKKFELSLKAFKPWLKLIYVLAFFGMILGFFLYYISAKLIFALLFAFFAIPANKMFKAGLTYAKLLNISFYAITPAAAVSLIIMLSGNKVPVLWLLHLLFFGTYLILGIKSARDNPSEAEITNA